MQALVARKTPVLVVLAILAGGTALVASGCSNNAIVVGNMVSMIATFGLFYTTINLRPEAARERATS